MKYSPLTLQIWIPFAFSIVLCGIVMLANFVPHGVLLPPAFPAFFSFLPIVFLFVASATNAQFAALEKRIKDLETIVKKPAPELAFLP